MSMAGWPTPYVILLGILLELLLSHFWTYYWPHHYWTYYYLIIEPIMYAVGSRTAQSAWLLDLWKLTVARSSCEQKQTCAQMNLITKQQQQQTITTTKTRTLKNKNNNEPNYIFESIIMSLPIYMPFTRLDQLLAGNLLATTSHFKHSLAQECPNLNVKSLAITNPISY